MGESTGHGPIVPKPEGSKGLKRLFSKIFSRAEESAVEETSPDQKPAQIDKGSGLANLLEEIKKREAFGKKDDPTTVSLEGANIAVLFEQIYPDLLKVINSPDSSGQVDVKTREDFLNGKKDAVFRVVNNLQMQLSRTLPQTGRLATPEGRKALICQTINIAVSAAI